MDKQGAENRLGIGAREKLWPERSTDDKLLILRDQVIQLRQQLTRQIRVVELLLAHRHGTNGEILASIGMFEHEAYSNRIPVALRMTE